MRKVLGLAAMGLLLIAVPILAHEEEDPVCHMKVPVENAKWTHVYAGKTYYFCNEADLILFKATPEKYVSMLREVRPVGKDAVVFALRPRIPRVGQLAKLVIKVSPLDQEDKPYELSLSRVTVYALDRSREPEPERFTLAPLPEKGSYALAMTIKRHVDHRVRVSLTLAGGRELEASFDFATDPELVDGKPLPGLNKQGQLDMEAQHETMTVMGEHWTEAWRQLASTRPKWDAIASNVDAVRTLQGNLDHFHLHKFVERDAEFKALAKAFGKDLKTLSQAVSKRDRDAAVKDFERIDQFRCLKCHLVFRWGVIKDFSQIPELNHE